MAVFERLQRGSATIPSGQTTLDVVRGVHAGFDVAVDPEKTLLIVTARLTATDITALSWRLVDGDTIRLTRIDGFSTGNAVHVEWALVSFASGVRVQRPSVQLTGAASQGDATILSPLDGHGRFILSAGWESNLAMEQYNNRHRLHCRLWLPNATTMRAQRLGTAEASHTVTYHAQVVDYQGCVAHEVLHSAVSTTATTIDLTIPEVDPAKTWILGTDQGNQGTIVNTAWHADLVGATTLRLRRGGVLSRTAIFAAYVVEFSDGTEVRRHEIALPGVSEGTATFPAVAPSRSVAMASGFWGGGGASTGRSNDDSTNMARLYATSELVGADTHLIRRGTALGTSIYVGQVVQFPGSEPPPPPPEAMAGRSALSLSTGISL